MKDNFEVNVDDTINSGQVFLWKKFNSKWYGVNGEKILILGDKLNVKSKDIHNFFRFDDDFQKIKKQLSKDSIDKLTSVGIDKNIIDAYIDGQTALAQNIETDIKSAVGGNDQYKEMMVWAKENLSTEEVSAYNNTVNSRDVASVKLAVSGLKARMDAGKEPNLVQGKASITSNGYESWAQVTEAMADPRYTKDPAYQAEVQSKLSNSNL